MENLAAESSAPRGMDEENGRYEWLEETLEEMLEALDVSAGNNPKIIDDIQKRIQTRAEFIKSALAMAKNHRTLDETGERKIRQITADCFDQWLKRWNEARNN